MAIHATFVSEEATWVKNTQSWKQKKKKKKIASHTCAFKQYYLVGTSVEEQPFIIIP